MQPANRTEKGGLAASIRADEADPCAGFEREVEIAKDPSCANSDAEAVGCDQCHETRSNGRVNWVASEQLHAEDPFNAFGGLRVLDERMELRFGIVFLLALTAGCDTADLQKDFEDRAFATPEGFTQTDDTGKILSEDQDDWRTAPAYIAGVLIDPAFPNPARPGSFISIPVRVTNFDTVQGGLELVSYDANRIARRLAEIRDARDPGSYVFRFNGNLLGVSGLTRVFIVDNLGGLVSYGDLLIEL